MIETSAAILAVVSLAIFAAHALDAYRTGSPAGPGDDFACGPIRGLAMVRRWSTEDEGNRRLSARRYRAKETVEKMDCSGDIAVFKAHQLTSSSDERTSLDPGPAGFNWIEIDLKQSH